MNKQVSHEKIDKDDENATTVEYSKQDLLNDSSDDEGVGENIEGAKTQMNEVINVGAV